VERELIEQVLHQCGDVQVTAARRLGINRNTLHKKVSEYNRPEANGVDQPGAGDGLPPPPADV
jgi:Nif-specific regulatory protein